MNAKRGREIRQPAHDKEHEHENEHDKNPHLRFPQLNLHLQIVDATLTSAFRKLMDCDKNFREENTY
jgi:hypothetical protein